MTNLELQLILSKLPPNLEVAAFRQGNAKLRNVKEVYIGNERYLPGSTIKSNPDKIVIQYE